MADDGPLILIVEDDPDLQENLRILLEDEGFRVATTATPAEALAHLDAEDVAVVLADYLLPDGDGLQVLRAARVRHPRVRGILMTAFGEEYVRAAAVRQEGFEFLKKPFEVDEVLRLVAAQAR